MKESEWEKKKPDRHFSLFLMGKNTGIDVKKSCDKTRSSPS